MAKILKRMTALMLCVLLMLSTVYAEGYVSEQMEEPPAVQTEEPVTPEVQLPEESTDSPEESVPGNEPPEPAGSEEPEATETPEAETPNGAEDPEELDRIAPEEPAESEEPIPPEENPEREETEPEEPEGTVDHLVWSGGFTVLVEGDAFPENAQLAVTVLSASAAEYIHSQVLELPEMEEGSAAAALDIKILCGGEIYIPGQTLRVTVRGLPGMDPGRPLAVYHLPGSDGAGVESAASASRSRMRLAMAPFYGSSVSARMEDGSIVFDTDGFSVFYILSGDTRKGTVDGNVVNIGSGTDNTFYAAPGSVIRFYRQGTGAQWHFAAGGAQSITALTGEQPIGTDWTSGDAYAVLTVAPDAADGDTAVLWSGLGRYHTSQGHVTIIVRGERDLIDEIRHDTRYPVYLAVISNSAAIPGEPSIASGTWQYFPASYTNPSRYGTAFAATGEHYIPENIKDSLYFLNSYDGTNTMGVADATGARTLAALAGAESAIDWQRLLTGVWNYETSDRGTVLGDGVRLYDYRRSHTLEDFLTEYQIYPYVVKIQTAYSLGWHIDCCIVRRSQVRLNYDLNLPAGAHLEDPHIKTPSGVSLYPGESAVVDPGNASGLVQGTACTVIHSDGKEYSSVFLGWYTDTAKTGTAYITGDGITLWQDTTLYAGWETPVELIYRAEAVAGEGILSASGSADYPYDALVEFGAQVQEGYDFDGWYDGEEKISTDLIFRFRMPRQDVTYEARATRRTGTLTVAKSGMGAGESAMFRITGKGLDGGLVITLGSGESRTIAGLYLGEKYLVTEQAGWSWRYHSGGSRSVVLEEKTEVQFVNLSRGIRWLSGESACRNLFGSR